MSTLRDAMSHAALGWVKPELDETLRQVRNEVEYYVEDPADGSRMRFCAGYLHQVQGTLRMVELYAPAMVAEEMEQLANAIGAGQVPDRDEACATLMRGSVLLPDYLERLQNGHRDIPIVLLPLLNDIRSARAAPGINESVLFAFAPDSVSATEAELDHARGSLSGRNRELLDTVGNAVKEELLRIKDALDLHLRTGGEPVQLQTQVNELGAVADTLGMMGLGVARGVVVQQRDALRGVVDGQQQIDEGLLLDIAGALLYVDASLDDQVAHLGAGGSGEDDPSAVENRRTVEVLAHEAIANFAAAREHFVAFIETNWNHQQLQEVPRLLGEVAGALRMLDLATPADYLQGVRQYIAVELIGRQRVPSGRQLDTLADAMASLEYYLEALRERRPGREEILDITRTSLETLRYWPLPDAHAAAADASAEALPVAPEAIELAPWEAPSADLVDIAVTPAAPAPGSVPPSLPDITFDPLPAAADASSLVFAASTASAPESAQWTLSQAADRDEGAGAFGHFDPVIAEDSSATRWDALPPMHAALDALDAVHADTGAPADTAAEPLTEPTVAAAAFAGGFDPVAAEHDALEISDELIEFTFDAPLHNAGDVLSLQVDDAPTVRVMDASGDAMPALDVQRLPSFLQASEARETQASESQASESQASETQADRGDVLATQPDDAAASIGIEHADAWTVEPTEPADAIEIEHLEAVKAIADEPTDATESVDAFDAIEAAEATEQTDTTDTTAQAAAPIITHSSTGVHAAVIGKIELDDESARFLAELDAAAAQFSTESSVSPAAEPVAAEAATQDVAGSIEAGFEDDGENIDQDIREVFIEEFDEELVNLGNLLPVWRAAPDNMDRLRPIRRVFHTLKGSGRLVGARTLGEFSWKIEGMLNRVLDGTRPASPAVVAMVTQAYEVLPQLNAALRGEGRVSADLQAMQAIADRIAAGEETFHVPLQRATPVVAAPVDTVETVVEAPVVDAPVVEEASGTPANIDEVLREILEAEVDAHQATLQAWLRDASVAPLPVTDALLRAVHTMNGAFAMTDVPEITAVTGGAESFIKRSLAADATPDADGVQALSATAAAISATMDALQAESPRIPVQAALAARLHALADTLPEARWPALVADDDLALDEDDADTLAGEDAHADGQGSDALLDGSADAGLQQADIEADDLSVIELATVEAEDSLALDVRDAADTLAGEEAHADGQGSDALLDGSADAGLQQAEIEADDLSVIELAAVEAEDSIALDARDADAAVVGELTGSDDLSAYFDADLPANALPSVPFESEAPAEPARFEAIELASMDVEAIHLEPAHDDSGATPADAAAGLESIELTDAEDLSRFFDAAATPRADAPVAAEADAGAPVIEAETPPTARTPEATLSEAQADLDTPALDTSPLVAEPSFADVELDTDSEADTLDDALPPPPAFGDVVDEQQALDDGLTVVDALQTDDAGDNVLGLDAGDAAQDHRSEADAFVEDAGDTDLDAAVPAPFFELEDAPLATAAEGAALASLPAANDRADALAVAAADAADHQADADTDEAEADDDGADALDFSVLDQELVDIFVEEGKDLLDHCDGLISELRAAPNDREVIAGLQRDLHTLKGGARMAGINPIGDLGHGIESLLEAVAANRTDIDRSDVHLLERGFDRLHQMLTRTGQHRSVAMPEDLIAAFDRRTLGRVEPVVVVDDSEGAVDTAPVVVDRAVAAAPLSAPVPLESSTDEDSLARPQQEQVRVRADLLDRLVNHAGEVAIYRSRLEQQLGAFRGAMGELDRTNARLRDQLRRLDLETEAQIVARYQREQDQADHKFDPLELDRFSTLQQLSRALNESAADLSGLQGVLDDLSRQYDVLLQQQSRVSSELQDGLMRARMVPFDGLVPRLRRVVRQAGQDTGKQVHVILEGTHGELDRNVLDRMVAPLEHMLRNSVAHGLETPEQRRAAGKPEEGEIAIRLRREGSEIVLEVADDGAGLDREAIRRRAEQRGLVQADAVLGDAELDAMIFSPGFSTADQVSQLAGRGVGMDVVHNEVRQLGGSVDIHSVRGQGVTFTLRLPQTLAVTQAVFVQIGETTFAVPVASVSGIGRISRERFETANGGYHYGGEEFALHDLGTLIGQAQARAEGQAQVPLLLVRAGDLRVAVAIDQVLGNREIVVKPVGLQIASVPGIYGATITGDGRVVVILDVAPLVRRFIANPHKPIAETTQVSDREAPVVMVVDDSLTMRKVTGRILERHNFEVTVARDGIEALERLEERVPDLMLLDIEMPRMDGYELATAMRADPRYKDVPIVMITSRSGDKHRQRAFEIGVQRYLGKPYQELDLMRNVYDLLGIARVRD
ncbi:Hpt domain-containing protein [Stenotrophomonas sp. BIGb0135]|uniref:Hpt domain-containing protein n=1 Tax=Stenotrophomonas sp. BIGb0135 TaxID=2940620 RepID=UPI002169642F|nr:Hpt domain-containing protein [Stenotrophomonas sp. BIGb0135]MCS4234766.1 chemosensory pili system protein ChpA (sensor histidine kinase/response regulator) [Stenotrophomonas sp. BIGb0135]